MTSHWRVAMFGMLNLFVTQHRSLMMAGINTNPTELLIYLTVGVANVQKLMRERMIPESMASTEILPREWVVPISRNAIASATGLPRETVRRHVAKMIERGLLIEDSRGGVTPPPGVIQKLGIAQLLDPLVTAFARTVETMLRTGIIAIEED